MLRFHDCCPEWLSGILASPLRRMMHKPERLFAGLVSPGQAAVDLGCGPGYFTLGLARLVGPAGRVYAVDVQPGMLERTRRRAARAGLLERITLHPASFEQVGLAAQADFVLAFWMLHEVRTPQAFLAEVRQMLKPGGRFLLVEPKLHVIAGVFEKEVALAQEAGFKPVREPAVAISRAMLFERD